MQNLYNHSNTAGADAEETAKQYLISHGLTFIESNFSVAVGELDLIFKDQDTWVFVEVKYRHSDKAGCAAEYFTNAKRNKMLRATMCYLQKLKLNLHHTDLRLDLVAIDGSQISWIKNV